jgi:hypothetical protein
MVPPAKSPETAMRIATLAVLLLAPATAMADDRPSLCVSDEPPIFSCAVAGGRIVSLCATPDLSATAGALTYRFGRPGALELVHPRAGERPQAAFSRGIIGARGGDFVRFRRGDFSYSIDYMDGPNVLGNYYAGVIVHRGEQQIAEIRCARRTPDAVGPDGFLRLYRAKLPEEQYHLDVNVRR